MSSTTPAAAAPGSSEPSTPMTLLQLPQEIRGQIMDAAIPHPGINFMELIYIPGRVLSENYRAMGRLTPHDAAATFGSRFRGPLGIGIPQMPCLGIWRHVEWYDTENNESTYTRLAELRTVSPAIRTHLEYLAGTPNWQSWHVPEGAFSRLMWKPADDVFVLQRASNVWFQDEIETGLRHVVLSDAYPWLWHVRRVAHEFQAGDQFAFEVFGSAAFHFANVEYVYVIDRTIRLKLGRAPSSGAQWYYGNHCRYVEVLDGDDAWEVGSVDAGRTRHRLAINHFSHVDVARFTSGLDILSQFTNLRVPWAFRDWTYQRLDEPPWWRSHIARASGRPAIKFRLLARLPGTATV